MGGGGISGVGCLGSLAFGGLKGLEGLGFGFT